MVLISVEDIQFLFFQLKKYQQHLDLLCRFYLVYYCKQLHRQNYHDKIKLFPQKLVMEKNNLPEARQ